MSERTRDKRPNLHGRCTLFAAFAIASIAPVAAHDLVATTITWDRDISRIVFSHCAGCHRSNGSAFSLVTYAEARAWAPAIKDAVLQRRMPPWGAVKGFGDFRNDEALTAEQLELVAKWIDGGLPEGDPRDLPRLPAFSPTPNPNSANTLIVSGTTKLTRAMMLKGLLPTAVPVHASLKIVAQFPDGRVQALLWLQNYDPKLPHPFLLRKPLLLPAGTVIRGIPAEAHIALLDK